MKTTQAEIIQESSSSPEPESQSTVAESKQAEVEQVAREEAKSRRRAIIDEANVAISETENAIAALEGNDTTNALESLAAVTGKLEILLARQPDLALTP